MLNICREFCAFQCTTWPVNNIKTQNYSVCNALTCAAITCVLFIPNRNWSRMATSQATPRTVEPLARGWSTGLWKPSATASRAHRLTRECSYRSLRYTQNPSIRLATFRSSCCQCCCLSKIQSGKTLRTDTLFDFQSQLTVVEKISFYMINLFLSEEVWKII